MLFRYCLAILFAATMAPASGATAAFEDATIVFGGESAYPPYEWSAGGEATGINVDLQRAIAEAGGAEARHVLGDWPAIVRGLESGTIDVVAMFRSPEREGRFRFTSPFEFVHHAIYGPHGSANVTAVQDVLDARIAVEDLSFAHQRLLELGAAKLVLAAGTLPALEAVAKGDADYAILAEPSTDYLVRDRQLPLQPVGPPLWPVEYAFAVRKDRPELAQWLEEQLRAVMESGQYREIQAHWTERLAPLRDEPMGPWSRYAVLLLAAVVLAGTAWVWSLRRTLIDRSYRLVDESRLRKLAESRLHWAEDHDSDTAMPRRHRFVAEAGRLLPKCESQRRHQVVALKLADLDRTIRTLGHEEGVEATRQFAERLRAAGFAAVGQVGRDVFVLFADKAQIDREFRGALTARETVAMKAPYPRVFAGAATWPQHGETVSELLRKAELALSRAVERRTGWVDFRPAMEPDPDDLELVASFRQSAGDVIRPVFQPQLDLVTGRVIGAEALARWHGAGDGQAAPGVFIPLLEDAGLIRHVTHRMIAEAVRVAAGLRRSGCPCPVSVNVTVDDLLGWDLSRAISKALRAHDGIATDLKLELTETNVAQRPEILQWKMRRLMKEGITLSIDDFGTGYSTLAYLSSFPIGELKIDQSFIRGMMSNKKDMSIVASTVSMSHELGLVVVAEGVETEAELDVLRRHGCDRVQGYVFAKPLGEAEFVAFVSRNLAETAAEESPRKVARLSGGAQPARRRR